MTCRKPKAGLPVDELEYLPLSLLSQVGYCSRRAALLMNERLWSENADTARGRAEHENVHDQRTEKRGEHIKIYEYTVYSDALRLLGKCDCIEAVRSGSGCRIPGAEFPVQLYPIEYKHGTVREEEEYQVQLCAQAMCLEEMFHTSIPEGALFFISSHRRLTVSLDAALRRRTQELAQALHTLRSELSVPAAVYGPKCRRCSLQELCMPKVKSSARSYCRSLRREAREAFSPEELL